MKKYVPIVTDDPQDNVEAALNLVFIKDEEGLRPRLWAGA